MYIVRLKVGMAVKLGGSFHAKVRHNSVGTSALAFALA